MTLYLGKTVIDGTDVNMCQLEGLLSSSLEMPGLKRTMRHDVLSVRRVRLRLKLLIHFAENYFTLFGCIQTFSVKTAQQMSRRQTSSRCC